MKQQIRMIRETENNKRIALGLFHVEASLKQAEISCTYAAEGGSDWTTDRSFDGYTIYAGVRGKSGLIRALEEKGLLLYHTKAPEGEGFYVTLISGLRLFVIVGGSDTGALYGCLELKERIEKNIRAGKKQVLPVEIAFGDAPQFRLRGPAIGLQLTKIEPPRLTYEYPITPQRFPWFYDRAMWEKFLDQILMERCNVLYLWTGLPFSSLVKVPDYPEALEVSEEVYQLNREMFNWLTDACDRRGIWLVLKFYSIHIPLPLAEARGVELLQSSITPLNADYTYKSIVEFIRSFPHIGLMVCLGEALRGTQNKTDWFIKTIIPAVKEGIEKAGLTEEPPLILRGHDCDPNAVMEQAIPLYGNLYTMWKYNCEGLTTYLPAGKWQDTHLRLSSHGQTHIMNVHVVANLEPFRYGSASFIQKCVQAGRDRMGVNGLHLYPLFFWDWPYSADKASPRLLQMDRDWMWYKAWFRYAWNPDRDPGAEELYWKEVLGSHFHCDPETAGHILQAFNDMGECAPRILRRVGITEGNRQTMSLGMSMSQFTNVKRYRPNYELWRSASTPGEQPDDYVKREISKEPHYGETPVDMARETIYFAQSALEHITTAVDRLNAAQEQAPWTKAETEEQKDAAAKAAALCELNGWLTDITAVYQMTMCYAKKLEAAYRILRYKYTMDENLRGDLSLLEGALIPWEESMDWYRKLAKLTDRTYLYANSMQTPQRKIPFPNGEIFGHWTACLPKYEEELANFRKHLEEMKQGIYPGNETDDAVEAEPLPQAPFTLLSENCETYTIKKGEHVFTDMTSPILTLASELKGLTGIRFGLGEAITDGMKVKLSLPQDSQILLAYMNAKAIEWLQVPDLETNTHADDRGGLAVVFANAMQAESCPDMNIHVFQYEKGTHEIYMGTGGFTIVGVVPAGVPINGRNAGLSGETLDKLDWLYE